MAATLEPQTRELILDHVPADGSRIGNTALLRVVERAMQADGQTFDDGAFTAAREQLIADGVLTKG